MSQEVENNEDFVMTGSAGANIVPAPSGNHIAVCVGVIGLGTIDRSFKDHVKRQLSVRLEFELVNTSHTFKEEEGPKPFVIGAIYTLSMNPKAGLRKLLEGWRGVAFSKEEAEKFNIGKILGASCMVNVVHKVSETNGNKYANIASISALPEGVEAKANVTPLRKFTFKKPNTKENFMDAEFKALPEFLQNIIKESDEFKELSGVITPTTTAAPTTTATRSNVPF